METTAVQACANCGGAIGRLETPYAWGEHVVCGGCYQRLASQAPAPNDGDTIDMGTTTLAYARPAPQRAVNAKATGGFIVCPACDYRGRSIPQAKGSGVVAFFLLCMGGLPGLLYAVVCQGYFLKCPHCGMRVRDEMHGERPRSAPGGAARFLLALLMLAALVAGTIWLGQYLEHGR